MKPGVDPPDRNNITPKVYLMLSMKNIKFIVIDDTQSTLVFVLKERCISK